MKVFAIILWVINFAILVMSILVHIPELKINLEFSIEPLSIYLVISNLVFLSIYLINSKNKKNCGEEDE